VNERSNTPSRCAGVVAAACTQGKRTQHGKPRGVVSDDQPDAREGQAGRPGVAERSAVPLKPGNAGGGKGPQFKTDAIRGEGPGDWATYQLRRVFRNCRWRCTRKRRQKPAVASTPCTTRSAVRTSWYMPTPSAAPTRVHPGVDGQDFADIDAYGVQRWLGELAIALRQETYRPEPIRRVFAAPPPTTARGFVPWRLSDAGQRVRGSVDHRRHPKPCTGADIADIWPVLQST
jgi:hypothetical protein